MSQPGGDLDRNEPASPYKLQKAHERGSIVRSTDLTFAVVLLAAVAVAHGLADDVLKGYGALLAAALPLAGNVPADADELLLATRGVFWQGAWLIAPVVAVLWAASLLAASLQARGVFSAEPLKPDFSRIHPAQGFKRLFSMKMVFDLLRSILKLGFLACAGWAWGVHHLHDILGSALHGPGGLMRSAIDATGSLLVMAFGAFVLFACLDWSANRWEFGRSLRMSRREIKDEHKEREGDPRIKSRLRELRVELARRARAVARVKDADVLLVNPTHYAVALQYVHGRMPAPMVVAKGAGEMAQRLKHEARRCHVAIVENAPLARALFAAVESDEYIPETEFTQVARILRWVYAARQRAPGQGSQP